MEFIHNIILFLGGILAGLYASSVGGGGLLSFPLLLLIGLPTHVALGTQKLSAMILEFASAAKFHKEKKLNSKIALPLGILAGLGSVIGSNLAIAINETYINGVIALLLSIIFILFLYKDRISFKRDNLTRKHYTLLGIVTFFLGIWGGMFSGGFGAFVAMIIVLFGFSFIESAAMSRVIGFFMSAIGFVIFAQHQLINYSYGLSLGIGFAIGGWIGIHISLKKGEKYIKHLLSVVIVLTIIQLLLRFFQIKIF